MEKKKLVPKRRFAGFEREWEKGQLGQLANISSSNRVHKKDYVKTGIPFFRGAEISLLGTSSKLKDVYYISEEHYKTLKSTYGVPQIGDILITAVGTLGNSYLVNNKKPFYFKDGNLIWLNNIRLDYYFLNVYLGNGKGKKRVLDSAAGSNQSALTMENLQSISVFFPNVKEQRKIGTFFKHLDDQVSLQQKNIAKTKALKKAYLAEMFPEEGECVPKRRFSGFTGEWERGKLGEIASITMGQSPDSKNYTQNPSDNILVQGNADMVKGKVFPRVWTTQVTKTASKGDLIFCVRAPVGDVGKTDYDVVLGRGVAGIKGNNFLYQLLIKMKENNFWNNLSTGSTFDSINSNDISEAIIKIPSPEEQRKIGHFFKKLDEKIANEEKKLRKLQSLKQAYLHEMFV